jgi:hypothetical protein
MECTDATTVDQGDLAVVPPSAAAKGEDVVVLWGLPVATTPTRSALPLALVGGPLPSGHCDRWTIPPSALRNTPCAMDGTKHGGQGPNKRAPGYLHVEFFRLGSSEAEGARFFPPAAGGDGDDDNEALLSSPTLLANPPAVVPSRASGLARLLGRTQGLAPVLADGGQASAGVYVVAARGGGGGGGSFPSVRTTATGEAEFSPPLVGSTPDSSAPPPDTGAGVTMVDGGGVVANRPYQHVLLPAGGKVGAAAVGGGGASSSSSSTDPGPWRVTVANLNPSGRPLAGYALRATCLPAPPPAAAAAAQRAAAALALAPPAASASQRRARAAAAAAAASAASAWVPCPAPDPWRGACSGRGACVTVVAPSADTLSDSAYSDPLTTRACACDRGFGGAGCARPLRPLPLLASASAAVAADGGGDTDGGGEWTEATVPPGGWAHFTLDVPLPSEGGGPVDGSLLVELERNGGLGGPAGGNPVLFVKPFSPDGGEPSLGGDDVDAYADVPSFALQQERHYALRRLRGGDAAALATPLPLPGGAAGASSQPLVQRWYVAAYNSNTTRPGTGAGDATLRVRASYRDLLRGEPLACPFDCSGRGRCRDPFSPRDGSSGGGNNSSSGAVVGSSRALKGDQPQRDGFWCECDPGYGGALCEGRQQEGVVVVGGGGGGGQPGGGGGGSSDGGAVALGPRVLAPGQWDYYVLSVDDSFNYRTQDLAIQWVVGPDPEQPAGRAGEDEEAAASAGKRRRLLTQWPQSLFKGSSSGGGVSLRPATAADLAELLPTRPSYAAGSHGRTLLQQQDGGGGGDADPSSSSFADEGGVTLSSSGSGGSGEAKTPQTRKKPQQQQPPPTPPDHPNAFLSFDEGPSYPRKGAATVLSGAAADAAGATDAAAAAGAAGRTPGGGAARTPQALHGWLVSYSRLLDRGQDPPLPLRVSGADLFSSPGGAGRTGNKFVLSVYNSAYTYRSPFSYRLDVFAAAASREGTVHPYMSIVLGVTAAVVLVLLMTVARRLVARFGLPVPWGPRRGERWGRSSASGGGGGEGGEGEEGEGGEHPPHRPSRPRGVPPDVYERFPTLEWGSDAHREHVRCVAAARADAAAVVVVEDSAEGARPAADGEGEEDAADAAADASAHDECAICLTEFARGDRLRVLPCSHLFHDSECLAKWCATHDSCPVCRRGLRYVPEEVEEEQEGEALSAGGGLLGGRARALVARFGAWTRGGGRSGGGAGAAPSATGGVELAAVAGAQQQQRSQQHPQAAATTTAARGSSLGGGTRPPHPGSSSNRRSSAGGGRRSSATSGGGGSTFRWPRVSSPHGRSSDGTDRVEPLTPPGREAAAEIEAARREADARVLGRAAEHMSGEEDGGLGPAAPFPEREVAAMAAGNSSRRQSGEDSAV